MLLLQLAGHATHIALGLGKTLLDCLPLRGHHNLAVVPVEDESPKDPVPAGETRPSRCRAMVDAELVAECHVLGRQGGSRPEEYDEGAGQEADQGEHPGRIQGEGRPAEACPPNRRKPMLVSKMLAAWVRTMGY